MTSNPDPQPLRLDVRLLTAGAVLVAAGGLLGLAGLTAGGAAVIGGDTPVAAPARPTTHRHRQSQMAATLGRPRCRH